MSWTEVRDLAENHPNDAEFARRLDERFGVNAVVAISDMSGFSSRTRRYGIAHIFRLFLDLNEVAYPVVEKHGGRVYKQVGDDLFMQFAGAEAAVTAIAEIHDRLAERNAGLPPEKEIHFCVGVAQGRCLEIEDDIWGDPVNMASKLGEDLGDNDDILIADACYQDLSDPWKQRFTREEILISSVRLVYHSLNRGEQNRR